MHDGAICIVDQQALHVNARHWSTQLGQYFLAPRAPCFSSRYIAQSVQGSTRKPKRIAQQWQDFAAQACSPKTHSVCDYAPIHTGIPSFMHSAMASSLRGDSSFLVLSKVPSTSVVTRSNRLSAAWHMILRFELGRLKCVACINNKDAQVSTRRL